MDATPTVLRYQRYNPLRHLDWRWRHARAVVTGGRRASARRDDPESIIVICYVRAEARCRTDGDRARLARRWPALDAARWLAGGAAPPRWEVEARFLAGQGDAAIAAGCALDPETVRWFEAAFFQVRDRLARGRDWVAIQAVGGGPWNHFADGDRGTLWRYAAATGGVPLLEVFMAVTTGTPLPAWVRAGFAGTGAYAEGYLRLRCRLLIAALTLS